MWNEDRIAPLPKFQDPREELRHLQYEYRQRIQPYVDILCDIEAVSIHRLIITSNGELRCEKNYTPEQLAIRKECQDEIASIKKDIERRMQELHRTPSHTQ